jgi:hypothetical protein
VDVVNVGTRILRIAVAKIALKICAMEVMWEKFHSPNAMCKRKMPISNRRNASATVISRAKCKIAMGKVCLYLFVEIFYPKHSKCTTYIWLWFLSKKVQK